MTNKAPREIPPVETVVLTFNHKDLVSKKKSIANGSDIRIVYQTPENEFKVLKYRIEFPNSIETRIFFNIPDKLAYRTENFRYFIYFNNPNLTINDSLDSSIDKIFNRKVILSLEEEILPPFFANFSRYWIIKNNKDPMIPLSYSFLTGTVRKFIRGF